jgi:hypothetical protein
VPGVGLLPVPITAAAVAESSRCLLSVRLAAAVVVCCAVQQGDENFELARDFCVQRAWYHTFPAVNPRETEAFYAECVAACRRCVSPAEQTLGTDSLV